MTVANTEQAEHWNSEEARHWVTHQARYDRMLAPIADVLFDRAALTKGERVLDIGCGCGATTIAAARAIAPGDALGVDLSVPMLDRARYDAAKADMGNVRFEQADAQVHPFGHEAFDAVISRFGTMFFADPPAAFANMRRSTKAGGRITFVCWQSLTANEWLLVPGAAISEHMALPDLGPPDAPGMFALADPDRTRTILTNAGWRDIQIESHHTSLLIGGGGSLDDTIEFLRTGSLGRTFLNGADANTSDRAIAAVRAALGPHMADDGIRLDAAVWLVAACT